MLDVTVAGSLDHATKLQQPRKTEVILAIVSWRSAKELSLLAWSDVDSTELATTGQHFSKECDIHKAMYAEDSDTSLREEDIQASPARLRSTAISRGGEFVTPEAFSKRSKKSSK